MPTDFETAINTALRANATLTGLVGTKIRPTNPAEKDLPPSLTFSVSKKAREQSLDGPIGVCRCRLSLVARSLDYDVCKAIKEALRNMLDGFVGDLSGVAIVEASMADESDVYEQPADGSDQGTFEVPCEFFVRFREPLPVR